MNYLVTGASGFIGRNLVRELLSRPHSSVHYLARKPSRDLPPPVTFHPWNEGEPLDPAGVPDSDVVFHLAGEPIAQRWTSEVKKEIYDSRVGGTRNLVAALERKANRPAVLVSASAIGYYGDRGGEVLTEAAPPGSDFLARVCIDWEREAQVARQFGTRVVCIRIATVLGAEGGALPKMLPLFRFGLGAKFGNGEQWMSWIHVDDLVRLFLFAADNDSLGGAINGGSPQPVTNANFTHQLGEALHRPAFLWAPKPVLKLALGEMSEFLFSSLRVEPQAARRADFAFQFPDLKSALRQVLQPA